MSRRPELRTYAGHPLDEVASSLQKSVRRGLEREALHWASEMDLGGFTAYAWRRLVVTASEDVGPADPQAVTLVHLLAGAWREQKEPLLLVHAVIALCRAPKSRLCDHAYMVAYEGPRLELEVPDWALDQHTRRGRRMGRGLDHFRKEGARLANPGDVDDPYEAEAWERRATGIVHRPRRRQGGPQPRLWEDGET